MDILLADFINDDGAALERRLAAGRARLHVHFDDASNPVLPDELCRIADAIILYSAVRPLGRPPSDFPRCKVLVREGVGYDTVDLAGWGAAGVPVCNVPDYGTSEVADHALALDAGAAARHGDLPRRAADRPPRGLALQRGAVGAARARPTFGVVGMGRIGMAAAMRARGFGMEIAFHDPYLASGIEIALDARRTGSLRELMETCDVLSLHCPASGATRNMIDAALLRHAKPGLVLINTARGSLVDLDALHDALHAGRVAARRPRRASGRAAGCLPQAVQGVAGSRGVARGRLTLSPHAAFYSPESLVDLRTQGHGNRIRRAGPRRDSQLRERGISETERDRLKPARTGRGDGELHLPVRAGVLAYWPQFLQGALLTIRLSALAMTVRPDDRHRSARSRAATARRPLAWAAALLCGVHPQHAVPHPALLRLLRACRISACGLTRTRPRCWR